MLAVHHFERGLVSRDGRRGRGSIFVRTKIGLAFHASYVIAAPVVIRVLVMQDESVGRPNRRSNYIAAESQSPARPRDGQEGGHHAVFPIRLVVKIAAFNTEAGPRSNRGLVL